MKILVDGCLRCPMCNDDTEQGFTCKHPESKLDEIIIPWEGATPQDNYIPLGCPLTTITIERKL